MQFLHTIEESNARQIAGWMQNRQGIVRWDSIDFTGRSWTGPYLGPDGQPVTKPHYAAASEPTLHITDPALVGVVTYREVKRFRIHVQESRAMFMGLELTDASSRKVRRECERAGEGATYVFDYEAQEAIILAPAETVSLLDWIMQQPVEE